MDSFLQYAVSTGKPHAVSGFSEQQLRQPCDGNSQAGGLFALLYDINMPAAG